MLSEPYQTSIRWTLLAKTVNGFQQKPEQIQKQQPTATSWKNQFEK